MMKNPGKYKLVCFFEHLKQEDEISRLKSDFQDEKVNSELKLTSAKQESEETLKRIREEFDREKTEFALKQNEKCSK